MCDQTEVSYLEDDVVWVKIGPIWWPGVVKDLEKDDEGKAILAGLKKKPIATVKFFQEDNYEFVKNLDCIYHYSCRRKDEFIKKGLDKFRAGAPHMKKFPVDVTTAESLTNGDINIINDPKFLPEKKESYSEIFGSGKKKTKKDTEGTPRPRGRPSGSVTPYRPITHQRFINKVLHGESDHKVKTLIQTNSPSEEGVSGSPYKCHICKFETSRVNVIVAHHRLAHSSKNSINWTGSDGLPVVKRSSYKSRKVKAKKVFDTSKDDFSDDECIEKKKSPKGKKARLSSPEKNKSDKSLTSPLKRKKRNSADGADTKKPRFTDVLLADWNEDEEEDKKDEGGDETAEENVETKNDDPTEGCEEKNESSEADALVENSDSLSAKNQTEKMSCFDFDEEEEGFIGMSNANTYGRKIPRVIPVKDKPELGMDLEIEELFKNKSEDEEAPEGDNNEESEKDETSIVETKEEEKVEKPKVGRRRRSKASKDEEQKVNAEDSLALRRTRRIGAKKSYLNEIIEKIEEEDTKPDTNEKRRKISGEDTVETVKLETSKLETGSSSRRKQDFRHQIDNDREEVVYSEMVTSNDQKPKSQTTDRRRGKRNSHRETTDDLTAQIDNLLEETKPPSLMEASESKNDKANTMNLSFDFVPGEQTGKKAGKGRTEMKSISAMFSDVTKTEVQGDTKNVVDHGKESSQSGSDTPGKTVQVGNLKFIQCGNAAQKRGSIVLTALPKSSEAVKVVRQSSTSKDCIVLPAGKKFEMKEGDQTTEAESAQRLRNVKTLPKSLISSGKLKGQTILHPKFGKYVIVTQPAQAGRQRTSPGKVQPGSKFVIFTNQLGEQKIITTSGLQQSKFKVDGQKLVATPDSPGDADGTSSSAVSQQHAQPIIKVVPDGKGGIMKQLTVSPKKVLVGGTKVLVSGSGSTFSSGNAVQKIALSPSGGAVRSGGGDYRLIENYKGTGKTVLIQGSPHPSSGVVLKPSSVVPRQVRKVIQNSQAIPALKKKPKILMRASTGQGEFVMQQASGVIESPAYVVKHKGPDGKFSAQEISRTEIVSQGKAAPATGTGTKRFILSGQGTNKKGESFIIATNETVPSKVIRMRQKVKESDGVTTKVGQKVVQKTPEVYAITQNNLLIPSQGSNEVENAQIVQVEEQAQQPVLQTQVIAMPGPVGADGNQTYVLVSVDEHGVVQGVDNSVVAYDAGQQEQIFVNSTSAGNVILLNSQANEEVTPIFSTSSQDILAEALANTNVLEGNMNNEMESVVPSILLPPSIPSSVVQETSITLQKPIMTPLEMPSSVAPDTSGLEPPPLPPTPTDEDVLMEESENAGSGAGLTQEQLLQHEKKEGGEINSNDAVTTYLQPQDFEAINENAEHNYRSGDFAVEEGENQYGNLEGDQKADEKNKEKEHSREEYSVENQHESQGTNSFQSMPLLSDEPDTSDDAQGSEPVGDQPLETQKMKMETEQFSQSIREQEPPSSTNELNADGARAQENSSLEKRDGGTLENDQKESEEKSVEEQTTVEEEKDVSVGKENETLPITADESSVNAYEVDPAYADVMSHKRFQEETEVSSTTDEYASKGVTN